MKNTLNFILFQSLWVCCILGAKYENIWPATLCLIVLMCIFLLPNFKNNTDSIFLQSCLIIGFLLDSTLAYSGLIEYKLNFWSNQLAPLWILYLWIGFALTLNHSMSWLINKPKFGYFFIMVGTPLSYYSAEKLDALKINFPIVTLFIISLLWLLVYKFILSTNRDFEKYRGLEHA